MLRVTPHAAVATVLVALAFGAGCASLGIPKASMPSFGGDSKIVGSPAWWRKHKKKAEFVPGSGYRVAEVDGFFDSEGRPIRSRAAKVLGAKDAGGLLGDVKFQQKVRDIRDSVGLGPNEKQSNLAYTMGQDYFKFGRYGDAAKKFKEAAASWPDSALEQDAWFYQAESDFYNEHYSHAIKMYEKLVKKYPNSPHLDKIVARQFAIARYWDQYQDYNPNWPITPNLVDNRRPLFDTHGHAMRTYEQIRLNDPTGPLADDAIMAAGNSYFLHHRYIDADEQYTLLRKEYPRSEHQYNAHILGLQCKLRKYQGPAYDETPLVEGQTLVKQIKTQFAGELDPDQRNRLTQIDAELRRELAQRDFNMGKYYDDLEEYGSAKFYYAEVLKRHGTTPLAEEARTRLASINTLPDRPTSKLDPLLDLVPQNSERSAIANVPLRKDASTTAIPAVDRDPQMANRNGEGQSDATTRR